MGDVEFKPNRAAFRQIMKSGPIRALLAQSASLMKASADSMGSGVYAADVRDGAVSAHGMVKTTDIISRRSNAKHNSLLKSIDAGRV